MGNDARAACADNAEVAAYHKAKVKSNSQTELEALVTEFGYGLSFFDKWQERGVRTAAQITAEIAKLKSTQVTACGALA